MTEFYKDSSFRQIYVLLYIIFEDLANLSYDVVNPGQGGSPNVNWAVK